MKLITDGSHYSLMDGDVVVATSMGNHGRFPKQKPSSKSSLEKITEKIKNKLK